MPNTSNYSYSDYHYDDLPMEILVYIFSYLKSYDVQNCSLVSKHWEQASQHTNFVKNVVLNFSQVNISQGVPPIIDLLNSDRRYINIVLDQVEFGKSDIFWTVCGPNVQEITFKNCDINEKSLVCILKAVPSLIKLQIENCRELFMTGRLFEAESDIDELKAALKNVKILSTPHNRYFSDALFSRFVNVLDSLKSLDLSGCHISFHKGLYKRFYPESVGLTPSESILTFLHISKYIANHSSTMQSLNFSSTLIDGTALETLSKVEGLALQSITLRHCDQLTNPGIIKLIQSHTMLSFLDLSYSVRITDHCVVEICKVLPRLKVLKLRRCRALTDYSVLELGQLNDLEVLDISECESLTGNGIVNGIASKIHPNLKELYIGALNICENTVIKITHSFPSLLILDISFCLNAVSDICVQMIFKHLIWLRSLYLDTCERITDAGMTGADMLTKLDRLNNKLEQSPPAPVAVSDNSSLYYKIHDSQSIKISLGSRAEDEIKFDAERRKAMQAFCESNVTNGDFSGFNIARLRGLRKLIIPGCTKISDVSLKYCFKFTELKELSLARCQQISLDGIQSLVLNCPAIETLNLSECYNINDKAIEVIVKNLHRFTSLSLEKCFQLTDFTLDYIEIYCKTLRYLDLRGCRNMSDPNIRLSRVRSLKQVLASKQSSNVSPNNPIPRKPKAPPLPK